MLNHRYAWTTEHTPAAGRRGLSAAPHCPPQVTGSDSAQEHGWDTQGHIPSAQQCRVAWQLLLGRSMLRGNGKAGKKPISAAKRSQDLRDLTMPISLAPFHLTHAYVPTQLAHGCAGREATFLPWGEAWFVLKGIPVWILGVVSTCSP